MVVGAASTRATANAQLAAAFPADARAPAVLTNAADALVTCSHAMRDEVAGLFDVDPDGITVLHNGIDPSGWAAPAPDPVRGRPTLVTFGRLEWEKGIQDVIAALPAIRRAHPGTRLAVAGTGSHAAWLAQRARAARVRRAVTMLGHVDDAALVGLLARASAVVRWRGSRTARSSRRRSSSGTG